MYKAFIRTDFSFPGQKDVYRGKVRDVYTINDEYLVMVVTDRISAFDVILPRGIPYKGQVLNQIADYFLDATAEIVPNWKIATPDPNVMIGLKLDPVKVEMVIRGYLSGHVWREYKSGRRTICGVSLPEGMKENDRFPEPIITPTTKATEGHDEDITREEILERGWVKEKIYQRMEKYTRALFKRGSEMAARRNLILVDTKYEFGLRNDHLYLIDEIHTPDSSRYFYAEGYRERQEKNEPQHQLSKEFVREWLMSHGFSGKTGQQVPDMGDAFVQRVSERYIELYENITGQPFIRVDNERIEERIETNVSRFLESLY